jgi:maleylpyruvate isomerase
MKLFYYRHSSASRRVRIALALKNVDYEAIEVDLSKGEHQEGWYQAIHPQCLVPALAVGDGIVLTQSEAIVTWLDDTYPEPPLFGRDPKFRAAALEIVGIIGADVHPLQGLRLSRWLQDEQVPARVFTQIAQRSLTEGLNACEFLLQRAAENQYCFGNQPGAAEIWLVPQLANARRHGVEVERYQRLAEIEQACLRLDAFRLILFPET